MDLYEYFTRNQQKGTECEKIVGTKNVSILAKLWIDYNDVFKLIETAEYITEAETTIYSSDELKILKIGIGKVRAFMGKCYQEIDSLKKDEELKKLLEEQKGQDNAKY